MITTKHGNISYLGKVNPSSKLIKGVKYNVDTYGLYLSPSDSSGYQVCPMATKHCISACLTNSGRAAITKSIPKARIVKTKLLFEEPKRFTSILIKEIRNAKKLAEKKGHEFSCRINCTSDLDLRDIGGVNLLEEFKDVQFYEYSKQKKLLPLQKVYSNINYTFSYSGDIGKNWRELSELLDSGQNCAIVFYPKVPKEYKGYEVFDGDISDLRYKDNENITKVGKIIGLKYKRVKGDSKESIQNNKFIIKV